MQPDAESPSLPQGPVVVMRRAHFCAAHRLHNPNKGEGWNTAAFGPCNNPLWHGHNYEVEVAVIGTPDPETGYVIDLKELNEVIQARILQPCDHANLNEQVPFLAGINPTTENLVRAFWGQLEGPLRADNRRLFSVKLYETPRNVAEYRGPTAHWEA